MLDKKDQSEHQKKINKKEENWVDDVMERQKKYVEEEEEILSNVPARIKHKFIDIDEE